MAAGEERMTEMRDDLRELGRRLWPDDSVLRPAATERRSTGRCDAPRRLVSMAVATATVVGFAAVAGLGLWAHQTSGPGHSGGAAAPTATPIPLAHYDLAG